MSYLKLHEINNRAAPEIFLSLQACIASLLLIQFLHPGNKWISLNFNQIFNMRDTTLTAFNNSNYKIGKDNKILNRITCFNNKIELDWLNKDEISFKIISKQMFL